ncbi:MAG: sortase [Patescibacteria group bacterium]
MNLLPPHFVRDLKKLKKKEKTVLRLTKIFAVLGSIFLFLSFAPSVWYSLTTKVDDYSSAILATVLNKEKVKEIPKVTVPDWQPVFNSKLSRNTTLKIPEIGLDTIVNERTYQNYEDALKLGVWRVPDFGTPTDRSKPVILAAHRFGYLAWTNIYRRKNSFYNLPKLKNGNLVEIIYKQRKYTYEIYGESRGDEITDYSANLILYTCETLNSNIRIFKYARLLQM